MTRAISRWTGWLLLAGALGCGASAEAPAESPRSGGYANRPADAPQAMEVQASATVAGVRAEESLDADDSGGDSASPPAPGPAPARMLSGNPGSFTKSEPASGALAQAAPSQPPPGAPGQPAKAKDQTRRGPGTASDVAAQQSPMLIYTAQITMAVFEVKRSISEVEALGREVGGFLAKRSDNAITIRVPAARFDEAVKRLEKLGDMLNRNVTAEDVTEEFFDLEVRLRSARAVRDRLEQLLAKANKVEESVLIERELERVGGEIERLEGRMKFLKDRAAYSTITVTFQPRRSEVVGPNKFNLPVPWLYELGLSRLLNL